MPKTPLNIVFFGTSNFAVPALKFLIQNGYMITGVFTQPEKPAGRLKIIAPSPVKKIALENKIKTFEPHSLKDDEAFKNFKHLNPDIGVVVAYGKVIPSSFLEFPKYGFVNIHPSLLPKYRGPSPIQTAIINGDPETGVSIIKVDEELDHGPILKNRIWKIESEKYYRDLEEELAELGARLLLEILPGYIAGEIQVNEQNHSRATFTKKFSHPDGKIDWNREAEEINDQIRALNPEPGTWTTWQGKIINIKKSEVLYSEPDNRQVGLVKNINKNIAITTRKCYLILKQIQLEGGKEMDAQSFVNGHPDFLDSILE